MRSDRDPELEELFTDGELRDTAWLLRSVPHPTADPDPAFRAALRRRRVRRGFIIWRSFTRPGQSSPTRCGAC